MKRLLVFFFIISFYNLLAESLPLTTPAKSDAKTSAKTVEAKSADAKAGDTKPAEPKVPAKADTSVKIEPPAKKELPPLQKEGNFYVYKGVKWQADNVTQKTYLSAKESCEKDGMRLPTKDELLDAYQSKHIEFRTPAGAYVSGNRVASDRSKIWYISFDNGHHNHGTFGREFNVRCVKQEEKQTTPAKTESTPEAKK